MDNSSFVSSLRSPLEQRQNTLLNNGVKRRPSRLRLRQRLRKINAVKSSLQPDTVLIVAAQSGEEGEDSGVEGRVRGEDVGAVLAGDKAGEDGAEGLGGVAADHGRVVVAKVSEELEEGGEVGLFRVRDEEGENEGGGDACREPLLCGKASEHGSDVVVCSLGSQLVHNFGSCFYGSCGEWTDE